MTTLLRGGTIITGAGQRRADLLLDGEIANQCDAANAVVVPPICSSIRQMLQCA